MNATLAFAHLLDWVAPRDGKDHRKRHKEALVAKHEAEVRDLRLHFDVLLDLANGLKHMHRAGSGIGADALQRGRFTAGMPAGTSLRPLVVDYEGRHVLVDSMLFAMCSLWHREMTEHRGRTVDGWPKATPGSR